ncbi:MAG: type II secretion system F family protein [Planctomycetaceae bacterium]
MAPPLAASKIFPQEIVEMISVGEEANNLEEVLVDVADNLERRTNRELDMSVRMLEPLMLLPGELASRLIWRLSWVASPVRSRMDCAVRLGLGHRAFRKIAIRASPWYVTQRHRLVKSHSWSMTASAPTSSKT